MAMSEVAGIKTALTQNLRNLHLPTIRECYEEVARQANEKHSVTSAICMK